MLEEKDVTVDDIESDRGVMPHDTETWKTQRLEWAEAMWANKATQGSKEEQEEEEEK